MINMKTQTKKLYIITLALIVTLALLVPLVSAKPHKTLTLTGIKVTNGGSGYTTPVVIITGNGHGATATAHVSNGVIYSVTLLNPGTGYTQPPTITFRDPSPRASGATAQILFTIHHGGHHNKH
jgi:hypothetical protein